MGVPYIFRQDTAKSRWENRVSRQFDKDGYPRKENGRRTCTPTGHLRVSAVPGSGVDSLNQERGVVPNHLQSSNSPLYRFE